MSSAQSLISREEEALHLLLHCLVMVAVFLPSCLELLGDRCFHSLVRFESQSLSQVFDSCFVVFACRERQRPAVEDLGLSLDAKGKRCFFYDLGVLLSHQEALSHVGVGREEQLLNFCRLFFIRKLGLLCQQIA